MPGSSSDSGPIPPSPPSSAAESAAPGRGGVFPLVLAAAAVASSWNLLGAPFALVTAAGALALALRARSARGSARTRARVAIALSLLALVTAVVVLVTSFRGAVPGAAMPGAPTPAEGDASQRLDAAERETAPRRDAARGQLEQQGPHRGAESGARR